jgi:hypothetical protein
MSSPALTAGQVMDKAASLLNDTAKQNYTYTVQLPYLQMALQDLRKLLELNNSPVTNEVSSVINCPIGTDSISYDNSPNPELPDNLIEIQQLWERAEGTDPWVPMTRVEFLPHYYEGVLINQFLIWTWQDNQIRLIPANTDNDIKIDYVKSLFNDVEDENSELSIINADSYLQFRTAALCAEYIGENPTRALSLNLQARDAFDILIGIDNKGRQAIMTRRRPFRAAWKNRGW